MTFIKVDVDTCEEATEEFGITVLPSFVLVERISDKETGLSSSHLLNTFIGKNSPVLIKNEAQKWLISDNGMKNETNVDKGDNNEHCEPTHNATLNNQSCQSQVESHQKSSSVNKTKKKKRSFTSLILRDSILGYDPPK